MTTRSMSHPQTHQAARRCAVAHFAASLLALGATSVMAQVGDWPKGAPIKIVVPFTAGSGTDVLARTLAEKLALQLGAQVVVDNKPGAGGTLGAAMVAKAPADGYTLLVHSSGHVANPALYLKLPYDTLKDLEGITTLASLPNVLVTSPVKGFKDVADLVAKAKARPDAMNYASAGNGSATHMNAEQFRIVTGVKAQHVPYRGTPEAMSETMSGRIDWFFAPLVSAMPLIKDGKLQALAVGTAARSSALPDVPSIADAGLKDAAYTFWVGLFVTAKTPRAIVERLHAETLKAMALPDVRERLDRLGAIPLTMAQPAFEKFLDDETRRAAALVKSSGIKLE